VPIVLAVIRASVVAERNKQVAAAILTAHAVPIASVTPIARVAKNKPTIYLTRKKPSSIEINKLQNHSLVFKQNNKHKHNSNSKSHFS